MRIKRWYAERSGYHNGMFKKFWRKANALEWAREGNWTFQRVVDRWFLKEEIIKDWPKETI